MSKNPMPRKPAARKPAGKKSTAKPVSKKSVAKTTSKSGSACRKLLRLVYFIPLTYLLLERLSFPFQNKSIYSYLDIKMVAATTMAKAPISDLTNVPSLEQLTESYSWSGMCPGKMTLLEDVHEPMTQPTNMSDKKIPMIIHQTAKSRCVTSAFSKITSQWKLPGWRYYFHDERAMNRLLSMEFPEFPHLKAILRNCVTNGTLKADLWRYLALWVYGGVYADFDSAPNEFNANTIKETDDAFFIVEQYHILSQWFMAVSPRHPLMYYAVQHSLLSLMGAEDTKKISAPLVTGPHSLHRAYIDFRADAGTFVDPLGTGFKPVWSGHFLGTNNRTVTIVGKAEDENQYVQRLAIDPVVRKMDYMKMGMTHFSKFIEPHSKKSGLTCLEAMLTDVTNSI